MVNRVMPTAKMVWYPMLPAGVSPEPTCTMNAVIVWMLCKGLRVRLGVMPAARATAMVSPMARARPSKTAATTPDMAAGRTTRVLTSSRVADRA